MKKIKKMFFLSFLLLSLCCVFSFTGSAANEALTVNSLSVKNVKDGVYIKWNKCEDASFYQIYRKSSGGKFKKITDTEKADISYTDTSALSGKSYTYKVVPCTETEKGSTSKTAEITCLAVPSKLRTKNVTAGIKLTWQKVNGADRYTVYRKLPGDKKWTHRATVKTGESFTDEKVQNGTDYIYTVIARKGSYASSHNKSGVSAHFIAAPELTKISNRSSGICVSWKSVKGAEEYVIYRKSKGSSWKRINTVSAKKRTYIDETVEENKKYTYTVKAKNEKAVSGFTSGLSYKFIPIMKISSASNANGGVLIKWKKAENATSYKLYRKNKGDTDWTRIAHVKGQSSLSFTDEKALSGKTYTYTLIVVSGDFQSTYDSVGKTKTYVAAPQDVKVKKADSGNIVTWSKVKAATHYTVYRKADSADSWKKLTRVKNTCKYTDSSAKNGAIYFYRIKADINSKYSSAYSKTAKSDGIDPSKKMLALTYDDGPSSTTTNRILNVLEKYDAKATFFVIGSRVDSYSESLIRAHKLGCEIGNHTYNHINLPSYSNSSILDEVDRTDAVIKKYIGTKPTIIRAPGGSTNQRVRDCVDKPFIYWSVDTRDWEHRNSAKTVSHIKNTARDGAIILMHDIYPATATASETVIPWLIDQGYQLVTVSELMEYRKINMKPGNSYSNAYK